MARIIRALPRMFTASGSGFEDTSKILLAQKLVVVHILDSIQQVPELWPSLAKLPQLERIHEGKNAKWAGSTDPWASRAALAFRIAEPKAQRAEDRPRDNDKVDNAENVASEAKLQMVGEWSLPRTPVNKYPWPCDWYQSTGSHTSGSDCSSRNPRKRRRPDYLPVQESGKFAYMKFSPIGFDIFNCRGNAPRSIVIDSDSDEGGLVFDSSGSEGDLIDSDWDEAGRSNGILNNRQTIQSREQDVAIKGQNNGLEARCIISRGIGGITASDTERSKGGDFPRRFQAPLTKQGTPKDKERASQPIPRELSHFDWGFGWQERARGNAREAAKQEGIIEESMGATMEAIDKVISEASRSFPNLRSEEPSSSVRPGKTGPGSRQIIGKDGRPSRLMPPSTVAYFKEEEERSKLAAEARMVYDRGMFLRARRGPSPVLEHPRPQRFLTVVEDLEAWMRGERLGSMSAYSSKW